MSNKQLSFVNTGNKYIVPFVGDNYPTTNIGDQVSNISQNNRHIFLPNVNSLSMDHFNPNYQEESYQPNESKINRQENRPTEQNITVDTDRFEPYTDYLLAHGLVNNENNIRYEVTSINIDSAYRQSEPAATVFDTNLLENNPFTIKKDSANLTINHPDHAYISGDRIMISGLAAPEIIIRCGEDYDGLIFTVGSTQLIINYNADQNNPINLPSGYDIDGNTQNYKDLKIQISGFVGNSSGVGTYFDNIPINTINGIHDIKLLKDASNNYYPIVELGQAYSVIYGGITAINSFNVTITFLYVSGIPINMINAGYPTTANNIKEFQTITSVTKNTYDILMSYTAIFNFIFGGNGIVISKINDVNQGYPDPNYYIIDLGKIYRNVYMIRLISSEFPNSENVVKNEPESKKNNKLYWQNQDDGDYVYSIEISSGNYNPNDLISALETEFYNTPRINYDQDILNPNAPIYTNHNYIKVDINANTDIVTFKSHKEAIFIKPFTDVQPTIQLSADQDPAISVVGYVLTINHPNHRLVVGTLILISGAISYLGIPTTVLNAEHKIFSVIDSNNYTIKLPAFNLGGQRQNNGGGASVGIYAPDNIKLRFDFSDTLGKILGFRNSGNQNSVTPFGSTITNKDAYSNEVAYNSTGQKKIITNNSLQMCGDSYILMACTGLNFLSNTGSIKDYFTKILLTGLPGKVLFNTFVPSAKIFYEPLTELSSLEFTFYSPDGSLYNFNGLDHSFTIEITTIKNILNNTNLSERTIKTIKQ